MHSGGQRWVDGPRCTSIACVRNRGVLLVFPGTGFSAPVSLAVRSGAGFSGGAKEFASEVQRLYCGAVGGWLVGGACDEWALVVSGACGR